MSTKHYQIVTDRIVAMLETGTRPWNQPWAATGGGRPLRHDGKPYRGANVLNLWAAAMARGFSGRTWFTYKKAQELGGQVRKGAKSELAFYVGAISRTEQRDGQEVDRTIPFLKAYNVFNVDEVDGLPAQYRISPPVARLDDTARIAECDTWIAGTGAKILHGGGRAFFRPSTDEVHMPEFSAFETAPHYYGTMFHELTHWSGHESRLDRIKGKIFADPEYAFEELVAELGAAYLCADLHVDAEPRADHAAYIASWIKALKSDNRNIFRAASLAEKAAGYLHGRQPAAEQVDGDGAADLDMAA